MRENRLWRAIFRLQEVLERSIKAQIKGPDAKFCIVTKGVHILDDELRYEVLKLLKKMQFYWLMQNVIEEPSYLDELNWNSIDEFTWNFIFHIKFVNYKLKTIEFIW